MMRRLSTDDFLTLGMALTADKAAMEQRVRGVFARKSSAHTAKILAFTLCIVLGVGCFTTACRPIEESSKSVERDFESISNDLPAQTHVPDPEVFFDNSINENLDDTNAFLSTCVEAPFSVTQSPDSFSEPETEIASNVFLTIDTIANVPETNGYSVTRLRAKRFTLDEYRNMIHYFLPYAVWTPDQTAPGLPEGGEFDLNETSVANGFNLSVVYGEHIAQINGGSDGSSFSFQRRDGIVYREGYLVGDEEMENEFGEEIRTPISLAREDAQALSDRTLTDLGITGVVLDSAQRACLFAEGDASGKMPVLTRGWAFIYTQQNNGLHAPEYMGHGGGPSDPLKYVVSDSGRVQVYVDGDGVTMFWCYNLYTEDEVLFDNVAVISAESALQLFKDRLAHVMSYGEEARTEAVQIETLGVSLTTMALADDAGEHSAGYQNEATETCLMIPVWSIRFKVTYPDGMEEFCTYPFSATDGGALSRMDG